ncbi:hypothetical protein H0H92_016161, partial [Tricholoma furcatifolium]
QRIPGLSADDLGGLVSHYISETVDPVFREATRGRSGMRKPLWNANVRDFSNDAKIMTILGPAKISFGHQKRDITQFSLARLFPSPSFFIMPQTNHSSHVPSAHAIAHARMRERLRKIRKNVFRALRKMEDVLEEIEEIQVGLEYPGNACDEAVDDPQLQVVNKGKSKTLIQRLHKAFPPATPVASTSANPRRLFIDLTTPTPPRMPAPTVVPDNLTPTVIIRCSTPVSSLTETDSEYEKIDLTNLGKRAD